MKKMDHIPGHPNFGLDTSSTWSQCSALPAVISYRNEDGYLTFNISNDKELVALPTSIFESNFQEDVFSHVNGIGYCNCSLMPRPHFSQGIGSGN